MIYKRVTSPIPSKMMHSILMNVSDQTNHNHTPCLQYPLSIISLTGTELDADSDFIFNASLNGSREKAKNTVQKQ
jgi:hypothetical protein